MNASGRLFTGRVTRKVGRVGHSDMSVCTSVGMFLLSLLNQATSAVAKPIATAMVATDRMAFAAHIDPSYSQGDDNVYRHLI